jgi:hypothetical protein
LEVINMSQSARREKIHAAALFSLLFTAAICATAGLLPVSPAEAEDIPLRQAWEAAPPGDYYDKMVVLDPQNVYTGGLTIEEVDTRICGKGALILLDGEGIEAHLCCLDIDSCIVAGGFRAIHYKDHALGTVRNVTIVESNVGVWFEGNGAASFMINSIVYQSEKYGIIVERNDAAELRCNDSFSETGTSYVKHCCGNKFEPYLPKPYGNYSDDPQFVYFKSEYWRECNFHLRPESPCANVDCIDGPFIGALPIVETAVLRTTWGRVKALFGCDSEATPWRGRGK